MADNKNLEKVVSLCSIDDDGRLHPNSAIISLESMSDHSSLSRSNKSSVANRKSTITRKNKMKATLLRRDSEKSETGTAYTQQVDFSSFQPTSSSPHFATSSQPEFTAGIIEFSSDRELPTDEQRKSSDDMKTKIDKKEKLIQPMQISLKPYQIEELREAFDHLQIGMEQMNIKDITTIIRACGFEPDYGDLAEIIQEIKPACKGFVDFRELVKIFEIILKRQDHPDEMRRVFTIFDIDGTGSITLENLKIVAKRIGEDLHVEELAEMIAAADSKRTGSVSIDNFVKLITKEEYFD